MYAGDVCFSVWSPPKGMCKARKNPGMTTFLLPQGETSSNANSFC